jgi:hypothetical protein
VGSGDFGSSPVNPMLATMAPASTPAASTTASTTAPTTGSTTASSTASGASSASQVSGAESAANPARPPGVAATPTVDLYTGPGAVPPRPRRRSAGMVAAIALAGAAVAAGAVYFVMRSHDLPRQERPPSARPDDGADRQVAVTVPDTTAVDPKTVDPKAVDPKAIDPKAVDPKAVDPKAVDPKAVRKPAPKPDPRPHSKPDPKPAVIHSAGQPESGPDEEGDGDTRDKLKEATAALDRHEYDLAERLANAVINSPGGPKQHATARLIHGTVQCVARNDQEAAQIDLRSLEGFRALKTRLLNVCRSHGVLSAP